MAVAVDRCVVPRSEWATTPARPGSLVEVVTRRRRGVSIIVAPGARCQNRPMPDRPSPRPDRVRPRRRRHQGLLRGRRPAVPGRRRADRRPRSSPPPRPAPSPPPCWPRPARSTSSPQRVDEIEDDVLAMDAHRARLRQAGVARRARRHGARAARSTTRSPRAPGRRFPLNPATVLAASDVVPAAGRSDRQAAAPGAAGPAAGASATSCASSPAPVFRLPRVRRRLRTSGSAVLNLDPLADALRHGGDRRASRPSTPPWSRRPGLQLRLAVTALRAGVLRYVTEDGTIVEADARTPAPGESAGPVDLVDGAIASASVPMVFPPHPMADDDYVDGGVVEIIPVRAAVELGATRIFAVVAVPLAAAPRRARLRRGAGRLHRPALDGHDRRGRAPDLQPQRRRCPEGTDPHHHRPRRRRRRPLRGPARPPAHQQGLRLAAGRRRPGRGRRRPPGRRGRRHPRARSRPGARPGASRSRSGRAERDRRDAERRHPRPRPRAEGAGARPRRAAQAARLPGARRLRGAGGPSTRPTPASARPGCLPDAGRDDRAAA